LPNQLQEGLVRGTEQADIHLGGLVRTYRPDFTIFEETQEFDLDIYRQIPYLIEKQGSAMRLHQCSGAVVTCARK